MNVTFYELMSESSGKKAKRKPKKFSGIVAVSDDRQVFMDSTLLGVPALMALSCCGYEGSPVVYYKGRVFFPCERAKEEFPSQAEAIDRLSFLALEAAEGNTVIFDRSLIYKSEAKSL